MSSILDEHTRRRQSLLIAALLIAVTIAVYWPAYQLDFVNYDDQLLVFQNPIVLGGLKPEFIARAFSFESGIPDWLPLTYLSLMIDHELYGLDAGGYHVTNVLIHTANVLLLFSVLMMMTRSSGKSGSCWACAAVAALFAVHPLHVEPVAWVSSRKDLQSTFFGLLTIIAYLRFTQRRSLLRYLPIVVFFALSLMSKMMLVTLPFALLLLDVWPLRRTKKPGWKTLIVEKLPLFLLVVAGIAIMLEVYDTYHGVRAKLDAPLADRAGNAIVSYAWYVRCFFWPRGLAVAYPHPTNGWPTPTIAICAVSLVMITAIALWQMRRRPYVTVGWFWYLGTLVPVVGLAAHFIRADRYTYVPMIGVYAAIVFLAASCTGRSKIKPLVVATGVVVLASLAMASHVQLRYWHNTRTLFARSVAVTDSAEMHAALASSLRVKQPDRAIDHYLAAARIDPSFESAYHNLALTYINTDRVDEGVSVFQQLIRESDDPLALYALGVLLDHRQQHDKAVANYQHVIDQHPRLLRPRFALALHLRARGEIVGAAGQLEQALVFHPDSHLALLELGRIRLAQDREQDAMILLERAVATKPGSAPALMELGRLLADRGKNRRAIWLFRKAVAVRPDWVEAKEALKQ